MRFIFALLFAMVWSSTSEAATVVQDNAGTGGGFYKEFIGAGRTGTLLRLSSDDKWKTATFNVTVRTSIRKGFDISSILVSFSGAQIKVLGGSFIAADYYADDVYALKERVENNETVSLIAGVSSPLGQEMDVWDFLSSGNAYFDQGFFGNEFHNTAKFFLNDRSKRDYYFSLGRVAEVPIPASAILIVSGLIALRFWKLSAMLLNTVFQIKWKFMAMAIGGKSVSQRRESLI
jgi:hypothetical protein